MLLDVIRVWGPWAWFVGGLVLLGLEILAPGAFFLWFAIAAILVGFLDLAFGWAWQTEAIIFIVLSVVLVVFGRRYFARRAADVPTTMLNARAHRLIGLEAVLEEPVVDGRGRIRVDDTTWRVTGPDSPSGVRVRVVDADGAVLKVERV
jgi:membrane protein implicated in regulation of membrane protease activity